MRLGIFISIYIEAKGKSCMYCGEKENHPRGWLDEGERRRRKGGIASH